MITLRLKHAPHGPEGSEGNVPLEAESITPDAFQGKDAAAVARLPVAVGNQRACLGDFFAVSGSDGDGEILLEGDLARVKLIGAGMTGGRITIDGSAGMHLGAGMRGGRITVHGDAADWAGAEMKGGEIFIDGNAGHGLGGAYRGSPKGMNRGTIVVRGNAGDEAGSAMRRGLICIGGNAGDYAGAFMIAGTLLVFGEVGLRAGAGLKRGTLVAYHPPELLPSYRYACTYTPAFLGLLLRHLQGLGVPMPGDCLHGRYRRYSGDLTGLGKGEILVWEGT